MNLLHEVQEPCSALARQLLGDVPLPWCKCLRTCSAFRRSWHTINGVGSVGLNFVEDTYLHGCQSLGAAVDLLVGPHGLVTRSGSTLYNRLGAAMQAATH